MMRVAVVAPGSHISGQVPQVFAHGLRRLQKFLEEEVTVMACNSKLEDESVRIQVFDSCYGRKDVEGEVTQLSPKERAAELNRAFLSGNFDVVFRAVGGFDCYRLLRDLESDKFCSAV